jgi:anti-sigma B factor antagonist
MKPHQMVMAASVDTATDDGAVATAAPPVATKTQTTFNGNTRVRPGSGEPNLVPVPTPTRPQHTLILTGELDGGSARALETEIERLCEEGVTGITLDLRGLKYIDSIGVAVIAFRCGLCRRRGFDFALIPGSRFIHRVFEQAGVADLLPFQEEEVATPRRPALVLGYRSRNGCEP